MDIQTAVPPPYHQMFDASASSVGMGMNMQASRYPGGVTQTTSYQAGFKQFRPVVGKTYTYGPRGNWGNRHYYKYTPIKQHSGASGVLNQIGAPNAYSYKVANTVARLGVIDPQLPRGGNIMRIVGVANEDTMDDRAFDSSYDWRNSGGAALGPMDPRGPPDVGRPDLPGLKPDGGGGGGGGGGKPPGGETKYDKQTPPPPYDEQSGASAIAETPPPMYEETTAGAPGGTMEGPVRVDNGINGEQQGPISQVEFGIPNLLFDYFFQRRRGKFSAVNNSVGTVYGEIDDVQYGNSNDNDEAVMRVATQINPAVRPIGAATEYVAGSSAEIETESAQRAQRTSAPRPIGQAYRFQVYRDANGMGRIVPLPTSAMSAEVQQALVQEHMNLMAGGEAEAVPQPVVPPTTARTVERYVERLPPVRYPSLDEYENDNYDAAISRPTTTTANSAAAGATNRENIIRLIGRAVYDYVRLDGLPAAQREAANLSLQAIEYTNYAARQHGPSVRRALTFIGQQSAAAGSELWRAIEETGPAAQMRIVEATVSGVTYTGIGVSLLAQQAMRAAATGYVQGADIAQRVYSNAIRGTELLLSGGGTVAQGVTRIAQAIPAEVIVSLLGAAARNGYNAAGSTLYASGHLMAMIMAYVPPHLRTVANLYETVSDEALRYIYATAAAYQRQVASGITPPASIETQGVAAAAAPRERRRRGPRSNGIDPSAIIDEGAVRQSRLNAREALRDAARESINVRDTGSRSRRQRPTGQLTRSQIEQIHAAYLSATQAEASIIQRDGLSRATEAQVEELLQWSGEMLTDEQAAAIYGTPGGARTPAARQQQQRKGGRPGQETPR